MSESDLESEFELEMEEADFPSKETREEEYELETEETEFPSKETREEEFELEADFPSKETREEEYELETEDTKVNELAQKFFELSQQSFESETDVDSRLDQLLRESEYFLWDKVKKLGKGAVKGLAKKAWNYYGKMPIFKSLKALTGNARTLMKGPLGAAFKSIASVHPGGAAALGALSSLGLTETSENNIDLWKNYVGIVKEAYEQLAENFDERTAIDPALANRLVSRAFDAARLKQRGPAGRMARPYRDSRTGGHRRSIRVSARRGQRVIVDIV